MSVSSQTLRCFSSPLSSPSSSSPSNYQCSRAATLRCSLQQAVIPSQIEQNPPPTDVDKRHSSNGSGAPKRSGIQVPRQRYISVSKSELLQAIVSSMFPSPEESPQFLALSQSVFLLLSFAVIYLGAFTLHYLVGPLLVHCLLWWINFKRVISIISGTICWGRIQAKEV